MEPRSIGLVLSNFDFMFYPSEAKGESHRDSPNRDKDNWAAQYKTREARLTHLSRCGSVGNRGPHCENGWLNPTVALDPLPFRAVTDAISFGENMDGTPEGLATATSCKHQKFTGPHGEPGVDNQYFRFIGNEKLLNTYTETVIRKYVALAQMYRLLLEIEGVRDGQNDSNLRVSMYRGRDPLVVDSQGRAVVGQSQRIGLGESNVMFRTRGRIVDGELITEPLDVIWDDAIIWERRLLIRGMTLKLKLTSSGAEGVRLGYLDVDYLWESYSHAAEGFEPYFGASGPAAYLALHQLADGYRNPRTGECTALSSVRRFEFVRAHITHDSL